MTPLRESVVYVLAIGFPREGSAVLGVYSTRALAEEAARSCETSYGEWTYVLKIEIDAAPKHRDSMPDDDDDGAG